MHTFTIGVNDNIVDKFKWFLEHFQGEISVLEEKAFSDDAYLRSMDGMVESILQARSESDDKGVELQRLEW